MSITLYHYTDAKGADGIRRSKKIRMSRTADGRGDAVAGDGVYLTDKAPHSFSKMEIANDIFRDASLPGKMVKAGRVNFAIKIKIAKKKVENVLPDRHIWLYPGQDLDLEGQDVKGIEILKGPTKEHEDAAEQGFIDNFIGTLAAQ